jgi:Ring finger domain
MSCDLQGVVLGIGPGTRGNTCDICTEVMAGNDNAVTHASCENTFHRACMDEWTNTNHRQLMPTTCPKCRAVLSRPDAAYEEDIGPSVGTRIIVAQMTTSERDMYDFDMRAGNGSGAAFPTPAFLRFFDDQRQLAINWLSDYFVRLSDSQGLTVRQRFMVVMGHHLMMENNHYMVMDGRDISNTFVVLDADLRDTETGSWATDLHIVDPQGRRQLRPSVVEFFESDPNRAYEWLYGRLDYTQRELGLDLGDRNLIMQSLTEQTRQEILDRENRRRHARQHRI